MDRVVVVGASLAGLRTAESLRREGFTGELVLVGDEEHYPYDRPPLSKAFLGSSGGAATVQLRRSNQLDARWLLGIRAESLDAAAHCLYLSDRSRLSYDGLVVATGAGPRMLPGMPANIPGVHVLRTLADATALRDDLQTAQRVVIVGGGFIGSELASTCRSLGRQVTVLTPEPLLATALGPLAPAATARARRHGVDVVDDAVVTGIEEVHDGVDVRLADGSARHADVVVVAIGAVPRVRWLEGSGAKVAGGLVCDEALAVEGLSDVVAAGDVVSWPHPALGGELLRLEHWTNATEQARAAARRLHHGPGEAFAAVPSFWSDQFGIRLQGIGLPTLADQVSVVAGDPEGDTFVAEYRRDDVLVGAVVAGSPATLLPYRQELAARLRSPLPG